MASNKREQLWQCYRWACRRRHSSRSRSACEVTRLDINTAERNAGKLAGRAAARHVMQVSADAIWLATAAMDMLSQRFEGVISGVT